MHNDYENRVETTPNKLSVYVSRKWRTVRRATSNLGDWELAGRFWQEESQALPMLLAKTHGTQGLEGPGPSEAQGENRAVVRASRPWPGPHRFIL